MRTEPQYLHDILDAAASIEQFLSGKSEQEFASDELLKSGVIFKLFIIAEASNHISDKVQAQYPHIPWTAIRGFRNFVAHQYFHIRKEIIWTTATQRIPELVAAVHEILKNDYPHIDPEHL